ncbi:MAG: hypothetical protein WC829_01545 [Hyphomicrobium sp.]|jgi:hypothetical protein
MATSDQEQRSVNVPQHKRLAMGEKLNGTSYGAKGGDSAAKASKPAGGLSHVKSKK